MTKKKFKKYVDIDKIVGESDSKVLQKLPKYLLTLIKKVVRQKELNEVLNKLSDSEGLVFLEGMIKELNLTIKIDGIENLPEDGRCFFAANHPFGVLDGLILTHTVSTKYGGLKAIANDAFQFVPQLNPFIVEVNVYGQSSKDRIRLLNETYDSDMPITHFPAGEVSRRYNGKIQDAPWQKSFIGKAISSRRNIVPFHFSGRNSRLFYSVFMLRRFLGIKLNLELVLLPRELFRSRNKTITLIIGKPIAYQSFNHEKSHYDWAQEVRQQVYDLPKREK